MQCCTCPWFAGAPALVSSSLLLLLPVRCTAIALRDEGLKEPEIRGKKVSDLNNNKRKEIFIFSGFSPSTETTRKISCFREKR